MEVSALAAILDRVAEHIRRYMVLTDHQLDAVALWVAHTHALEAADFTPYLWITSAELASGKTRLLEVLDPLVARPWLTGRVSAAVLARKVDAVKPTLLLDESDAAFGGDRDYAEVLRGVLNTGYGRNGSYSVCFGQGSSLTYRDFATFCPKALAGLGRLPDTVESRSIGVRLKRRAPTEEIERYRRREITERVALLAGNLGTWAEHEPTIEALAAARPELPDELADRAQDVWEPLLAIAETARGEWPERARQAAIALSGPSEPDEETIGIRLLADCRVVFGERERIPTRALLGGLQAMEEAPWGDWYGKPVTARKLSDLLRPFEIRSRKIRFEDGPLHGFERDAFADAWARYLPGTAASPRSSRNNRNNGLTKPSKGHRKPELGVEMFRFENPEKPHDQADVPVVPVREGGRGEIGACECAGNGCSECLPPLEPINDRDPANPVVWDYAERAQQLVAVGVAASDDREAA